MDHDAAPDFGTLLKRLRVEAGLSQEALAKRARVSVQAVGAYERGTRRAPQRDTFALLVDVLNLNPEQHGELRGAAERGRLRGPGGHRTHDATPIPPDAAARDNLPRPATELLGRTDLVASIQTLLAEQRLVTLVGTGGIGKSRTAIEVAAALVGRFRDGVRFAELASVTDPALVAGAVAFAAGVAQEADRAVLQTLQDRLRNLELLLVLDNCEHLIDESARVTNAILLASPHVKVLATSRERLRVSGEHVYQIPPLALQDAVALFNHRSRSADSATDNGDRTASTVAEICTRLDGIPLAIELAAARVSTIRPAQLLRELDERFRVLVAGSDETSPRRKTMRAVIDWSYDLLSPTEQRLFRRLSVFAGGWTLAAAAGVCSEPAGPDDALHADDTLNVLGSLVDKSLVLARAGADAQRYDFLESTRAYAAERLDTLFEREPTARRHAEFVALFVNQSQSIAESERRLSILRADAGNIRSALAWSLARPETIELAARILKSAREFLSQNFRSEFVTQTRDVLSRATGLEPELQAEMLIALALVTFGTEALDAAQHAVALLERSGCRTKTLLQAYQRESYALAQLQRISEAIETHRRARVLHDELGILDAHVLASLHFQEGYLLNYQWQLEAAREAWSKARELSAELGDTGRAAICQINIAEAYFLGGDVESALRIADACVEVFRRENMLYLEALALNNMASYRLRHNDRRGAAGDLSAAANAARRAGDGGLMLARAVRHTARLSAMQNDSEAAAELLGYAAAWFETQRFHDPSDEREMNDLEALLRERLGAEDRTRLMEAGARLDEDEAWDMAAAIIADAKG